MLKAWLNVWKNIFNYKGIVSRKEYWLACIMNVLAMYVFMVPYALILSTFPISADVCIGVFITVFLLPMVSLYFRRANDANWHLLTAIFMALVCPIISGLIVGAFPSIPKGAPWPRFYSITSKLFALSFGLFFYGGVLGVILYGDPTAMPFLCVAGLLLGTATLIFVGIKMFSSK